MCVFKNNAANCIITDACLRVDGLTLQPDRIPRGWFSLPVLTTSDLSTTYVNKLSRFSIQTDLDTLLARFMEFLKQIVRKVYSTFKAKFVTLP